MAISLATAFGNVILTTGQAANILSKFAETMRDQDPEAAAAFAKGAQEIVDLGDGGAEATSTAPKSTPTTTTSSSSKS